MAFAASLAGCLAADEEPQAATGAPRALAEAVVTDELLLHREAREWRVDGLGG
jgi:hypothetical protein